jgi:uncharacterized protein
MPATTAKEKHAMSHVPHDLNEEFPQHGERIRTLKMNDNHFARLAERYHDVNRAIHRAEVEVEPTSDDFLEELKKQRLRLKDEIATMLRA